MPGLGWKSTRIHTIGQRKRVRAGRNRYHFSQPADATGWRTEHKVRKWKERCREKMERNSVYIDVPF
jgi:hypothetical protein